MDFDLLDSEAWNRTDFYKKLRQDDPSEFMEICYQIVCFGANRAGRTGKEEFPTDDDLDKWMPEAKIGCPSARFGQLILLDPVEIMQYRVIDRVIKTYFEAPSRSTPLCLAVFGRPGSGKSFGVKELVKKYRRGAARDSLVLNLAQFNSTEQLTESFHAIQSEVLAASDPPLIMFDEFDSPFDRVPLGWLKYFLAPMQDGQFRGARGDYRIGRAIFLFSGGVAYTFKDFRAVFGGQVDKEKEAKLPDFISRLHGQLDIQGINTTDENSKHLVMLQRALKLRSILEMHKKNQIFMTNKYGENTVALIRNDVIKWFLDRPAYKFGVRSMEAIVHSAYVEDETGFVRASILDSQFQHHFEDSESSLAQSKLGEMYAKGQGVPQDYAQAALWYRKAADQGDTDAQSKLGEMYAKGQGVPQDYAQAHMWLNLAATKLPDAADARDEVAAKITPGQIAEAQRMAREWVQSHPLKD